MDDKQLNSAADALLKHFKHAYCATRAQRRRDTEKFQGEIRDLWGKALGLLELQIDIASEVGEDFDQRNRDRASRSGDDIFEVLTRLHYRACQTSREIFAILCSGYADAAYARWRTLYEIVVIAAFIRKHDKYKSIAKEYLLHDFMRYSKEASLIQGNLQPSDDGNDQDSVNVGAKYVYGFVSQFGTPFTKKYGWAASTLDLKDPTLFDLEKASSLNYLRHRYVDACDHVHVNARGDFSRLCLHLMGKTHVLAGPSIYGLAEPGALTAHSLAKITAALLVPESQDDRAATGLTVLKLAGEIEVQFLKVHQETEQELEEQLNVALQPGMSPSRS